MRALWWHIRLSVIDLIFIGLSYFGCTRVGIVLFYPFHVFCSFIVPFLVIKNSFKQLDGMFTRCFNQIDVMCSIFN